jgi:hypothetical protein
MRAAAQLEPDRNKFIQEAFRRGRSGEWRLDNEAIRPIVLPLLHEFFDKPQHAGPDLRVVEPRPTPQTVIEALMWSLRTRRTAALKEPDTLRRLAQLDEEQLVAVAGRLQKLKPHIAPTWTDQEIAELIIARANAKQR